MENRIVNENKNRMDIGVSIEIRAEQHFNQKLEWK